MIDPMKFIPEYRISSVLRENDIKTHRKTRKTERIVNIFHMKCGIE